MSVTQGCGSRGGGEGGQLPPPQLFVSMGWICLCPPQIWQSLGISTLLPPPPKKKIVPAPLLLPFELIGTYLKDKLYHQYSIMYIDACTSEAHIYG